MAKDPEVRKITTGLVFSWIFGIFFVSGAIGALAQDGILAGFASLIVGLVLLPPVNKVVKEKLSLEFSTGIKWLIVIIGLIVIGLSMPTPELSPPPFEAAPIAQQPTQEIAAPSAQALPKPTTKTRSADLTIDRVTTQAANLQPIRVTVSNTGDIAISPKFDVAVTDRNGNEVCSGSPMFDEFDSISPGSQQTGEFTILACMFKNDGTYNVKVDLLDSDYSKLNTATKSIAVTYWSQFR